MSEGKYTKGPFEVVEHSWADTSIYGGGRRIALLSIGHEATEENQVELELLMRADAKLMGASHDLLEALLAAIDCGMVPTSSAKEGGANRHVRQLVAADMIRAAIAKATGVHE